MTPREFVKQIVDLLDDPDNWTTDVFARDSEGEEIGPTSEYATCWCLFGAITKVLDDNNVSHESSNVFAYIDPLTEVIYEAIQDVLPTQKPLKQDLATWQDNIPHYTLMKVLRRTEEIINSRPSADKTMADLSRHTAN